jgi:hypothetical protein
VFGFSEEFSYFVHVDAFNSAIWSESPTHLVHVSVVSCQAVPISINPDRPELPTNFPAKLRVGADFTAIDVVVRANSTSQLTINLSKFFQSNNSIDCPVNSFNFEHSGSLPAGTSVDDFASISD